MLNKTFIGILLLCLASQSNLGGHATQSTHAQFSYNYQTEVVFNDEKGFELAPSIEHFAKNIHANLNKSIFFHIDFLLDTKKIRNHHLKKKYSSKEIGKLFEVTTDDGLTIQGTFFDRGSDNLLIVGEGFTNAREKMTPFVDMFDCDIVLFDFRGHGYKEFKYWDPKSWPSGITELAFEINPELVTLGLHEEKDVFAIVDFFKKQKPYKQVNCLGLCYGAFVFLKAASMRADLFNKIILDGCWLSLDLFVEKIKKDLKLIISPQKGGWSKQWPFSSPTFIAIVEMICHDLMGLRYKENVSLLDYLPQLDKNIPILFFYGKNDLVIYRNEFETLWQAVNVTSKTAIITPNPHARNHLNPKEIYKLICDLFLELDQTTFKHYLKNRESLAYYHAKKILYFKDTVDNTVHQ